MAGPEAAAVVVADSGSVGCAETASEVAGGLGELVIPRVLLLVLYVLIISIV